MKKEQIERLIIFQTASVTEALEKIDQNAKGILFVLDADGKLAGSLTDGDIRRWLIKTADLTAAVQVIMNKEPKAIYQKEQRHAQKLMEQYQINCIPVLQTNGTVIDVVFRQNISEQIAGTGNLSDVPVIIMAGGKGTRLYPYTKILPKPLIPIGDIPIIERIINHFREYKIDQYYLTVNYKKNMIKSYFTEEEKSYQITYVEEDTPLGTAGSLCLIKEKFDIPVIVTNCDILIHGDYADIYKHHIENKNDLTVVAALKNMVVPYGVLNITENGIVTSMDEKPKMSYFVNTGMYILNPDIIDRIPENTFYHMTDLTDDLIKDGKTVGIYPISEDAFLDMGEFEEMNRMEQKLNLKTE